jgi:probable phosphomutase (TIGR03848 family)
MTTFFLVRHATTDAVGRRLTGRLPGVELNEQGRNEARALAARLSGVELAAIYTSPLERAQSTAQAIAHGRGLAPEVLLGLQEMDFGTWTGKTLHELAGAPDWQHFNSFRSGTRAPNGESMLEAQVRMVAALEQLREKHGNSRVALVSHGDPLRALLMHYLGTPLDLVHRIEVSPASLSVLELENHGVRLLRINDTGPL